MLNAVGTVGAQGAGSFGMAMREVEGVFISPLALVVGDVSFGKDCNIWPFVVARGDVAAIRVGEGTSVQDHTMLHCKHNVALEIGSRVLIGHHACVHCTRVGDLALIGIGARVLDGAVVGEGAIVAAGCVVPPGMEIPAGKLAAGVPAKIMRDVSASDRSYILDVVTRYVDLARAHAEGKFAPRYVVNG